MSETAKLREELNNIECLDCYTKKTLENVFDSWIRCKGNHLFIENVENSVIKVGRILEINGIIHNSNTLSKNTTIFLNECHNSIIKITEKFNHIVILKCNNANIYISHGLVSGIDVLHSNNITCNVKFSNIYYLACNYSDTFVLQIDENIANDMLLTTSNSYKVIFKLHNGNTLKEFITNMTYFPELTYYFIKRNKANIIYIDYINRNGNGTLR